MFEVNGVLVYEESEVLAADIQAKLVCRVADSRFFIASNTRRSVFYDLYLTKYDTALPNDWLQRQIRVQGEAPRAVWCYDENKIFGAPVFFNDVLKRFSYDIMLSRKTSGSKSEQDVVAA